MADLKSAHHKKPIQKATITFSSVILLTVLLLTTQISITQWSQKVSAKARIGLAGWLQPSPTPSSTPYLPARSGTTLSASLSASGFLESRDSEIASSVQLEPLFGVRGELCITNQAQYATENLSAVSLIEQRAVRGGPFTELFTVPLDLTAHRNLDAGEQFCYPYQIHFLAPRKAVKYRITVAIAIDNYADWLPGDANCPDPEPCPYGPTVSEDFTLPQPAPTEPIGPINPLPTQINTPVIGGPTQTAILGTPITEATPSPTPTPPPTLAPSPTPSPTPTQSAVRTTPPVEPMPSLTPTALPTLAPSPTPSPTPTQSEIPNTSTPSPTMTEPILGNIDLSLTMMDGQVPALPGGVVIYSLNYANYGTLPAGRVILTELLPANTAFNPDASSRGWIPNDTSDEYIYPIGELLAGGGASVTFAVTVDQQIPAGVDILTNTAHIAAGKPDSLDDNPADNTATITTPLTTP
jgi:uncharacterized repeat protein (TIGR01451 family)